MTDTILWQKVIYGSAFSLFGLGSLWLAYQIATGRVVKPNRPAFLIGAQSGLLAATTYVCLWIAVVSFRLLLENSYTRLSEMAQVLIAFLLNALWVGLLPAALAGGVTGIIIHYFFARRKAPWSIFTAAGTGALLCLILALLWHLALGLIFLYISDNKNPLAFTPLFYLLFIGLPSLIYIVVGARMSAMASQMSS